MPSACPRELKEQAKYLYEARLGRPMIAAARERGWTAQPSPHLAFRNSSAPVRLYVAPTLDAAEYARRWEEGDLDRAGAHSRTDVRRNLWPWLKSRGYATDDDDPGRRGVACDAPPRAARDAYRRLAFAARLSPLGLEVDGYTRPREEG